MTRAVYLFGAFMVLLGLIFISMGVPIVRLEIGWTEVIGGSVAASAGCVILVMGLFLGRLVAIQRALDRLIPAPVTEAEMPYASALADPAPVDAPPAFSHPLAPVPHRDYTVTEVEAVRPEPPLAATLHPEPEPEPEPFVAVHAPALRESAPVLAAAEQAELARPQAPAVELEGEPEGSRSRPGFLSSVLARRPKVPFTGERPRVEPARPIVQEPVFAPSPDGMGVPARRTPIDLSSGWEHDEPDNYAPPLRGTQFPGLEADPHPSNAAPLAEPSPVEAAYVEPVPMEPVQVQPVPIEPVPIEPAAIEQAPAGQHHAEPVHAQSPDFSEPEPDQPSELAPHSEPVASPATMPAETEVAGDAALQPVVVGRYNAGSASYVMYSNGMIEVETEQGTHQFASMAELKAFIERRDARVS